VRRKCRRLKAMAELDSQVALYHVAALVRDYGGFGLAGGLAELRSDGKLKHAPPRSTGALRPTRGYFKK
jgi:hypothetical protein